MRNVVVKNNNIAVIILAAGLGTRMKSNKAKVLHEILGRPMLLYVIETAKKVAGQEVILVVGNQAEAVRKVTAKQAPLYFAHQDKQLGTGHAVLCALPYISAHCENVVILCGDVPLITTDTIFKLIGDHLKEKRDITVLAVSIDNPSGYGRILVDENHQVAGIVEEADATEEQKEIKTINTGVYCVGKNFLTHSLHKIDTNNTQGELYLTDIVEVGYKENKAVGVFVGSDEKEFYGVNNHQDLIKVQMLMQERLTISA
jgi:bifunctional UDP-N-acetylglucosamine pyrophosphorylase/glucosamine-1-phosphate N-acetyltransferase/UDP-N-acetylglucosamine pyrophosphorylase